MPENQIPATQPEPGAEPGEFNFAKPASETPRIKRRSLKAKQPGLIKPSGNTPTAARELEREAPPLSPAQAEAPKSRMSESTVAQMEPAVKASVAASAPPRATPTTAPSAPAPSASASAETRMAQPKNGSYAAAFSPSIRSTATPSTSPHGTRPATLYYSSPTRKAETPLAPSSPAAVPSPSPMKTIPTAGPASSASTATAPSTAARSTAPTSRPTSPVDYRANVERQSREQKSVGSILSYVVYGLIAIFVVGAILAIYGANVIFERIHDQSVTVTELDAHYASANKDLNAKIASAQDTLTQSLTQAQAQITRQQDLIVKQQDEINKLINAVNDESAAIRAERAARAQDSVNLRARVRDLEAKNAQQKL